MPISILLNLFGALVFALMFATAPAMAQDSKIRDAQTDLIELGYLPDGAGSADGIFGRKSAAALDAFRRDQGLPATGSRPSPAELLVLRDRASKLQEVSSANATATGSGNGNPPVTRALVTVQTMASADAASSDPCALKPDEIDDYPQLRILLDAAKINVGETTETIAPAWQDVSQAMPGPRTFQKSLREDVGGDQDGRSASDSIAQTIYSALGEYGYRVHSGAHPENLYRQMRPFEGGPSLPDGCDEDLWPRAIMLLAEQRLEDSIKGWEAAWIERNNNARREKQQIESTLEALRGTRSRLEELVQRYRSELMRISRRRDQLKDRLLSFQFQEVVYRSVWENKNWPSRRRTLARRNVENAVGDLLTSNLTDVEQSNSWGISNALRSQGLETRTVGAPRSATDTPFNDHRPPNPPTEACADETHEWTFQRRVGTVELRELTLGLNDTTETQTPANCGRHWEVGVIRFQHNAPTRSLDKLCSASTSGIDGQPKTVAMVAGLVEFPDFLPDDALESFKQTNQVGLLVENLCTVRANNAETANLLKSEPVQPTGSEGIGDCGERQGLETCYGEQFAQEIDDFLRQPLLDETLKSRFEAVKVNATSEFDPAWQTVDTDGSPRSCASGLFSDELCSLFAAANSELEARLAAAHQAEVTVRGVRSVIVLASAELDDVDRYDNPYDLLWRNLSNEMADRLRQKISKPFGFASYDSADYRTLIESFPAVRIGRTHVWPVASWVERRTGVLAPLRMHQLAAIEVVFCEISQTGPDDQVEVFGPCGREQPGEGQHLRPPPEIGTALSRLDEDFTYTSDQCPERNSTRQSGAAPTSAFCAELRRNADPRSDETQNARSWSEATVRPKTKVADSTDPTVRESSPVSVSDTITVGSRNGKILVTEDAPTDAPDPLGPLPKPREASGRFALLDPNVVVSPIPEPPKVVQNQDPSETGSTSVTPMPPGIDTFVNDSPVRLLRPENGKPPRCVPFPEVATVSGPASLLSGETACEALHTALTEAEIGSEIGRWFQELRSINGTIWFEAVSERRGQPVRETCHLTTRRASVGRGGEKRCAVMVLRMPAD